MIIALNNKSNLNKEEFLKYQEQLATVKANSTMILCASPLNISNYNLNNFNLGAQNVSAEPTGAYTGEIAASQLKSFGVKYCIVGHSERRKNQKETNIEIAKKIKHLYQEGIIPILCIGETKDERESGKLNTIIEEEILVATENLTPEEKETLIVAYEPIWSISPGPIPKNEEIEEVFQLIKKLLPNTKVLYGGNANDENINELKKCLLIDGYLLGRLSLKPDLLKIFIEKLEN